MKEAIIQWLVSNGILVGAGVAFIVAIYFARKKPKVKKVMDMVNIAFSKAETLIPNDTPNKGLAKLDKGLQLFSEMYKQTFEINPNATLIEWVKEMFAILARGQKIVKSV